VSRRQLCVFALIAIVLAVGWPAPARAADATVTIQGVTDVAGVLRSLTLQPGAVTVPAGSEVAFVNGTNVTLTVTVSGKSIRLAPGASASMLFTGASQAETFGATATALNLPLVGTLTSSVAWITVLAVPAVAAQPAAPRSTGGADSGSNSDAPATRPQPDGTGPGADGNSRRRRRSDRTGTGSGPDPTAPRWRPAGSATLG
jgi:hypothetical protein